MTTEITDEHVRRLAATARPYSVVLLWWGPERDRDGADTIELAHQRRMVSLRADGDIAILGPATSDTLAGVLFMTVPPDEARAIIDEDPCVQAQMLRCEVHQCHGFPGDTLPG